MRKITLVDFLAYVILLAIVMMLVRPGSQAAAALVAITEAFAALISAAEGQTHAQQNADGA